MIFISLLCIVWGHGLPVRGTDWKWSYCHKQYISAHWSTDTHTSVCLICKIFPLKAKIASVTISLYKPEIYGVTAALWWGVESLWHEFQSGDQSCILVEECWDRQISVQCKSITLPCDLKLNMNHTALNQFHQWPPFFCTTLAYETFFII